MQAGGAVKAIGGQDDTASPGVRVEAVRLYTLREVISTVEREGLPAYPKGLPRSTPTMAEPRARMTATRPRGASPRPSGRGPAGSPMSDEGAVMRRTRYFLLVIAGLILGLAVSSVDFASGRHVPPVRKNSTASFAPGFTPPGAFECTWDSERGPRLYLPRLGPELHPAAVRAERRPCPRRQSSGRQDGWKGLAAPNKFLCEGDGSTDASHYRCTYKHKDGKGSHARVNTHQFRVDEIVSVSVHESDPESLDQFYLPHRHGSC